MVRLVRSSGRVSRDDIFTSEKEFIQMLKAESLKQ